MADSTGVQYLLYFDWLMVGAHGYTWLRGCDWLMGWDTKCVTDRPTDSLSYKRQ